MSREETTTRTWWQGRRVRWGFAILGGVGVYSVVAGLLVPWLARGMAESRLTALAGGPVRIDAIRFQPFALRLQIRGFALSEPDGKPLLTWSNFVADLQASSLWRWEPFLRLVALEAPTLHVRRSADGRLNLVELGKRLGSTPDTPTGSPASTNLFPASVARLWVTNATVEVEDAVVEGGFRTRLTLIQAGLDGLSTRSGATSTWRWAAQGDAGEDLGGEGTLVLSPLMVAGVFHGADLPVVKPQPYLRSISPLQPTNGLVAIHVPFRMEMGSDGVEVGIEDGSLSITNLEIVETATGESFADARGLGMEGLMVSLNRREASLGLLRLAGGTLHVRRTPGTNAGPPETNLRGLVTPEVIEATVRQLTDWRFGLSRLEVEGTRVDIEDRTLVPPARLEVSDVTVTASGLTNQSNAPPSKVDAAMTWCGAGRFELGAEGTVLPAAVRAGLRLDAVDLRPLGPYLSQFIRLTLGHGAVSANLEARYGRAEVGSPLVTVSGGLAVTNVAAVESASDRDFIRWDAVEFNGIRAALEPNLAALDELVVRRLQTSLILLTNGQLNVLDLIRRAQEAGESASGDLPNVPPEEVPTTEVAESSDPAAPPEPESKPFWETWPVRLDRLRLEGVGIFAADHYLGGGFRTSVESLDGEVRNLALPAQSPAEIDLKGRLSAVSGFELVGTLNPDPGRFAADLELKARRADLVQFAPYTLRFASYPVTRGELTADVHYRIEGSKLEADNRILLDQFTLGPKTPHPEALDLPLKLGVALLKDTEGRIELDVPLTGSLDDPQFRVAPVLWQAVRNILVKAATAPFRLLGSLLGGDGADDDFEFVEFAPGSAEVSESQGRQLERLVQALAQRPQLQIEIVPEFHPAKDRRALAEGVLNRRLVSMRVEEIGASGAPLPDPERVELTTEDRRRLLVTAYERDFGAPPPAASPEAGDERETAILDRVLGLIDVSPDDLRGLARRRAQAVEQDLVGREGLGQDRVTVASEVADTPEDASPRVRFLLQ